jgi:hypothetical protein
MSDDPTLAERNPEADLDNLEQELPDEGPLRTRNRRAPGDIREPFDPKKIEVVTKGMTVDLLLKRLARDELTLQPDFQRSAVWTKQAKSRLIESMLIRLPLPLFYFDASDDDDWLTVDGLQRLTAIKEFMVDSSYALTNMEFLDDFEGRRFKDLPRAFQRRLEETEIQVSLIQAGTPEDVKFNLFKRINTGGMPLSPQEIRHALNQGPATLLLARMASSREFRLATGGGVAPLRMGDRELALRFLAFTRSGPTGYSAKDLDFFLHAEMKKLNVTPAKELTALRVRFRNSMALAYELFGRHAFRKVFSVTQEGRSPVNKALFDAWSVAFGRLTPAARNRLVHRKKAVFAAYVKLMNDEGFLSAISQGTGQPAKVELRLRMVDEAVKGLTR